ncbi:MAG: peptidoglycan editing factor PgeF [Candidatus Acidiferrales bacterium]
MKTIRKNKFIARGKKRVAKSRSSAAGRSSLSPAADWKLRRSRGLQVIESSALGSLRWLVHGFSTRMGGTSELAAAHAEEARAGSSRARGSAKPALNLGFTDWDASERVQANRHRFFHALGADGWRVVTLRQIHSDIVHLVESPRTKTSTSAGASDLPATGSLAIDSPNGDAPQGDALITRAPGTLLVVQTADCVPILLADTRHRAVAAIHSGWRGTVRRIAEKTLGRMQMEFGTRPRDVIAAIGPAIGPECYEVGHEVVQEFATAFPNALDWFEGPFDALASSDGDANWLPWLTMRPPGHAAPPPRAQLDLIAANRAILEGAGVPSEQISSSGFCTACRTDLLFSYRRERITGRLMAAIGIR